MEKKIRFKKRNFIFIFISLFFYIFMIVLFWNLSFMMFKNSTILIATENIKNLRQNIEANLSLLNENNIEDFIINTTISLTKMDYIKYLNISNSKGENLFFYGTNINIKKREIITIDENLSGIIINKDFYQILFNINGEFYFEIVYDLSRMSQIYFYNKREIFLVVVILNFMILFFLTIMILNLQRRLIVNEQYINEIKTTDELTGLLSKEHFLKIFKKEAERAQRNGTIITLLIIDIDNFLNINEKYGYEFGTIILQTVSKIVENNFRNFDIIGRFGDDEVTVLMLDSDEKVGFEAAERCRIAIEENKFYYEAKQEITITVSIGIADSKVAIENFKTHPSESGKNFFRTILFNSLNALARAKRDGRNRVIKYSDL